MDKTNMNIPPVQDFDLKLLRVFKEVVDCNGLAAAEDSLGIGRSTISKHISDLEIRMNMKLCERGRAGFKVTPYGRTVYDGVIELFDSLDQFRAKVTTQKNLLIGSVSLWMMDNTHLEHGNPVAKAIRSYKNRPGNVELKVNSTDPERVEEAIRTRQAGVGITITNNNVAGLIYQRIGVEKTSIYCTKDNPMFNAAEADIIKQGLMKNSEFVSASYLSYGPILKRFHKNSSGIALHVNAKLQLILSGHYAGVLPEHIAAPWVESGDLYKVDYHEKTEDTNILYVVYRSDARNISTVMALIADITEAYRR